MEKFPPYNKLEVKKNLTDFFAESFLLLWIEFFIERGENFSYRSELCITPVSSIDTSLMTFILNDQCKLLN